MLRSLLQLPPGKQAFTWTTAFVPVIRSLRERHPLPTIAPLVVDPSDEFGPIANQRFVPDLDDRLRFIGPMSDPDKFIGCEKIEDFFRIGLADREQRVLADGLTIGLEKLVYADQFKKDAADFILRLEREPVVKCIGGVLEGGQWVTHCTVYVPGDPVSVAFLPKRP